ncbi:HMG (high mobility group) box protein [Ceratobasidium sp. AG-Ba]|nr:HMG (high mobility group) box protein [Ceratobasidium sp. AG-Ba]QRV91808.1 HMG (high mobility group) box protein [Ceratobasidium sp. AG-Ba]
MGSQTAFHPATQVDPRVGRSYYHPYHSLGSFNDLRHQLPLAISANPSLEETYVEPTWGPHNQPVSYSYPMHPLPHDYHFNHGQDANFQFPQGAFPYSSSYHDPDTVYNGEDLDLGSMSGDDDIDGPDSNAQLRSQQLNSDGTPKRPMNAFMIFARKRRPMVSSEQPTMRTGEISKLLSKEWSEMPKEDKQFYLDQAKKLKDTFNMRWPDYVYRRRPNNSRKRRKLVGASGIGPIRNSDASSDGRVGTPVDSVAGNHSSDDSRSQSADSPLITQSKLLYPVTDTHGRRSPGQISDRSPTPSVASVGYGVGPAYIPSAHSKNLGEQVLLGQAKSQTMIYTGRQSPYGGDIDPNGVFCHSGHTDIDPQLPSWHPFNEQAPSYTVGALTPSPPPTSASPSHTASSALASTISDPVYAPIAWTKSPPESNAQVFEGSAKLWGVLPNLGDYRNVEEEGVRLLLPGEDSTLGVSHLGFRSEATSNPTLTTIHPYDNDEAPLIESGRYHSAYMDANVAQPPRGPRSSPSASPYEGSLPLLHGNSSPYVG